ncbi:hypothetical protein [Actinosynnema sp. NPDC023587]|uniref:hypothetical protein n=1 Tax=Actinosynnema sp. NPDC023587 TaxID=3154695 RepID=UPI0033DAF6AF
MTGVWWRRLALVLLVLAGLRWGDVFRSWVPGAWGVALSVLMPFAVLMIAAAVPTVAERPQCWFQFIVAIPGVAGTDHVHRCRLDLGHVESSHDCRCGLKFFPAGSEAKL